MNSASSCPKGDPCQESQVYKIKNPENINFKKTFFNAVVCRGVPGAVQRPRLLRRRVLPLPGGLEGGGV